MKKFSVPKRLQGIKLNILNEYDDLAINCMPLSLKHEFPDEAPPTYVTKALEIVAASSDPLAQQYTRGYGHLRLTQAIAKLFSGLIDRSIDPQNQILITVGAYEALHATIMGHIDNGDEVIHIEPFFDFTIEPMVKIAGGIPRFIPLRPKYTSTNYLTSGDFCLVDEELESVFNEKTKMIIINSPHNPLGKVFTREELEKIAALCRKWDVICLSDEVYEWLVYEGDEHIRMCTLPGMWERTITVGSAGKTFSVTGWKTGWTYGPAEVLENLRMIHQNCVDTCPRPIQEALAVRFEKEIKLLNTPESYFKKLVKELQDKRDFTGKFLTDFASRSMFYACRLESVSLTVIVAIKIDLNIEKDENADYRFTKWMIKNVGSECIPPSVFYSDKNKHVGEKCVRFCFTKRQENLEKAAEL